MDFNEQEVRNRILREIDGAGSMSGYRSMWQTLHWEGCLVPRSTFVDLFKELDPEGCRTRWANHTFASQILSLQVYFKNITPRTFFGACQLKT